MKFLRYFILFNVIFCSSLFSMETKKQDNLPQIEFPQDIWREILSYVKNLDFKTEVEFIKTFNSLRGTNKRLYNLINEYIKSQVKIEAGKQYSYQDLMLELIDQIITKKAGGPDAKPMEKAKAAIGFEAYNWAKSLKGVLIPRDLLNKITQDFIESLIKSGEIKEKDYEFIEKLLKFGAFPNLKVEYSPSSRAILQHHPSVLWIFIDKNNPQMVQLFLKYGAEPDTRAIEYRPFSSPTSRYVSAIDLAKQKLRDSQGFIGYYTGMSKETEEIKNLKEIIKMLEDAIKKQSEKKELSGKEGKQEA